MILVLFFFLAANHDAEKLTRAVAGSGRVLEIGVTPSELRGLRRRKSLPASRLWCAFAILRARCGISLGIWIW